MNAAIAAIYEIEAEVVEIRHLIEVVMVLTGNDGPTVDPTVSGAVAEAARAKCNNVLRRCTSELNFAVAQEGQEDAA